MQEQTGFENFYVYEEDAWRTAASQPLLLDAPAEVKTYENAVVLPTRTIPGTSVVFGDGLLEGGVVDAKGNHVAGLLRDYFHVNANRSCVRGYEVAEEDLEYRDETVIFGGILCSHFGHMLYDTTGRLWYPTSEDKTTKVVFITFQDQEFPYFELLDLAGISPQRREIVRKPTCFARVIIPEQTCYSIGACRYKREWIRFFDAVRNGVAPSSSKRIYFTRTAYKIQNCIGEEYFEDFYRDNGYEIVAPEKLSLKEQVSLVAGADSIVATMGTVAALILFAKEKTNLTVLNRSREIVDGLLVSARARRSNTTLVDVYRSFLPEVQGGNCVYLLYPTAQWQAYCDSSGLESNVKPSPFGDVVLRYLDKWGEFTASASRYRWIKNHTLPSVAFRVNRYLRDVMVDVSEYPVSNEEARQRQKIALLKFENGFLKGEHAIAHVSALSDTTVKLEGSVRAFGQTGVVRGGAYSTPVRISPSEHPDELLWEATVDLLEAKRVQTSPSSGLCAGAQLCLCLDAAHGKRVELPIAHYPEEDLPTCLDKRLVLGKSLFRLDRDPELLLLLLLSLDSAEEPYSSVDYQLTSVECAHGDLELKGYIDTPLFLLLDIDASLSLRRYRDEDVTGFSAPLDLELSPCGQDSETRSRRLWEARISQREISELAAGDAPARWDLYLDLRSDAAEHRVRIGRRRPTGSIAEFRKALVVDAAARACAVPVETSEKNLSFAVFPQWSAEAVDFTVDSFLWGLGGALRLEGHFSGPLSQVVESSPCLLLRDELGCELDLPFKCERAGDELELTRRNLWSAELSRASLAPLASKLGESNAWHLHAGIELDGIVFSSPTGRHRPTGSMAGLKAGAIAFDDFRLFSIRECEGANIEFLVSDRRALLVQPCGADPFKSNYEITGIDCSQDWLSFSGRLSSSLFCLGEVETFLSLRCRGDEDECALRIPLSLDPAEGASPLRNWTAAISLEALRSLISPTEACTRWDLYLDLRSDAAEHRVRIGRRRPTGSIAEFRKALVVDAAARACAVPVETGEKNLSFLAVSGCAPGIVDCRIETVRWGDPDVLCLEGVATSPLLQMVGASGLRLLIGDDSGDEVALSFENLLDMKAEKAHWSVELSRASLAPLASKLGKSSVWHFRAGVELNGIVFSSPLGRHRPVGSMAVLRSKEIALGPDNAFVLDDLEDKNLVLRATKNAHSMGEEGGQS